MNVLVKTAVVSFDLNTRACKLLLDIYNNLLTMVVTEEHKSVEAACRQSIEEILKTDAAWMPIRFLSFVKDGNDLNIYYGVLVPEDITIINESYMWTSLNNIMGNEDIDSDVQKAIWEAVRKVK